MAVIAKYLDNNQLFLIVLTVCCGLFPALHWISASILAFIVLRKGLQFGSLVFLWLTLPLFVLWNFDHSLNDIYDFICLSGVFLGAGILRYTCSWSHVIGAKVVIGTLIVIIAYYLYPDIDSLLFNVLSDNYNNIFDSYGLNVTNDELNSYLMIFAKFALGILLFSSIFKMLVFVAVGRVMQAAICNPNGFSMEFLNFDMKWLFLVMVGISMCMAFFNVNFALNVLIITLLPFVVAGLSLVHNITYNMKLKSLYLGLFYTIFIMFFPYIVIVLFFSVLLDKYYDFKEIFRLQKRG